MDVFKKIEEIKLVPVTVFNSLDEVEIVLDALNKGDVPISEICFRTNCAKEAIKKANKLYPNMLIGAGTVINQKQAEEAIDAGAKFIVSPGLSKGVFDVCKKHNIPYIPGVCTPRDIMDALELGLTNLKFFPADLYGGLKGIKTLGSVFPNVRFMPTGGVSNDNLKDFIANPHIYACGGSWLVKGNKDEIIKTCLEARKIVKGE